MADLIRKTGTASGALENLDLKEWRNGALSHVDLYTWSGSQLVALGSVATNTTTLAPAGNPPAATVTSGTVSQLVPPMLMARWGADNRFPEMTLYSYDHAAYHPSLILDADVRLTTSGDLVVARDSTIDRIAAPLTGAVAGYTETTWPTVSVNWPTGSTWSPQPDVFACTWAQLADRWGGRRIITVEPRADSAVAPLLADIKARAIQSRIIFNTQSLTNTRTATDAGIAALLVYNNVAPDLAAAQTAGAWAVSIDPPFVTDTVLADAATRGIRVFVTGTLSKATMLSQQQRGIQGFVSDSVFNLLGKSAPSDTQVKAMPSPNAPATLHTVLYGACSPAPGSNGGNLAVDKWGSPLPAVRRFLNTNAWPATLDKNPDSRLDHISFASTAAYATAFPTATAEHTKIINMLNSVPAANRNKLVLEILHEADHKVNGAAGTGTYTVAQCIACKNKFYDVVKSVDSRFLVAATYTGYSFEINNTYNQDQWGPVKADILGIDLDGIHADPADVVNGVIQYPNYDSEPGVAKAFIDKWAANGYKWVAMPEWGTSRDGWYDPDGKGPLPSQHIGVDTTGTQRAAWIKKYGEQWLHLPYLLYMTFYDFESTDGNELEPGSPEFAEFTKLLTASRAGAPVGWP
jgi:glycerophosphoryl diester phosphodiesterase